MAEIIIAALIVTATGETELHDGNPDEGARPEYRQQQPSVIATDRRR